MNIFKKLAIAAAILLGSALPAAAQSTCPYIVYGAVLTVAQWNSCFASKADLSTVQALQPGGANGAVQFNNANSLGGVGSVASNGTGLLFQTGAAIFLGSSSGQALINAPATGGGTLTLPPGTDVVAGIAATQTLTNKTMSGASNTFTKLPIGIVFVNDYASAMSGGTPDDCTHDATPAVNAAKAALPGVGGFVAYKPTVGCYLQNVVMGAGWSGVVLEGPGQSNLITLPTNNYIKSFNNSLPAIQVGDGTANVTGWGVENFQISGGNYGLEVIDGANNGFITNVSSTACQVWCEKLYDNLVGGFGVTFITQTGGMLDPGGTNTGDALISQGDGSGYVNGITFNGVVLQSNGLTHALRAIGQTQLSFNGGYAQGAGTATEVSIEKSGTNADAPVLFFANFPIDNGGGAGVINIENQFGDITSSAAGTGAMPSIVGVTNSSLVLYDAAITTGTVSASSASLSVTSATGFTNGRTVLIKGAGASGGTCQQTVSSVSGTTVTLASTCPTAVSGAVVQVGSVRATAVSNIGNIQAASGFQLIVGAADLKGYSPFTVNGENGTLANVAGAGHTFPFNSNNDVFFTNTSAFAIGQQNGSLPVLSTYARSGTTVTVTLTAGPVNVQVGDQISISGETAASGINGTWGVTGINTGSHTETFTSNVSGTVAAPTGTITLNNFKSPYFQYGNFYLTGSIFMNDENGNQTAILAQSPTNQNFTIRAPDTSAGTIIAESGSTASTSAAFEVNNGTTALLTNNGDGALAFGGASANNSSPALVFPYGNPSQVPATNNVYMFNGAGGPTGFMFGKDSNSNVFQFGQSDRQQQFNQPAGASTTASSNGTSAACTDACNDNVARWTIGASPNTQLTETFSASWPHAPHCDATDETQGTIMATAPTASNVVLTNPGSVSLVAADKVSLSCRGAY